MNKKVVYLTILIIVGMIVAPTIYKINKNHQENLILVVKNEFSYQAELCYKKDKCNKIVYLKDLYDAKYLEEKLVNPISKKYYKEDSYINLETKEIHLMD